MPVSKGGHAALPLGERRQVTAIFVDLVGFSSLAARADAEDLQTWLDDFYRRTQQIVAAAGGEVTEFLGDGIVAIFGLGHADEFQALRAIEAAARIVAAPMPGVAGSDPVALRGGIATGEVAIRPVPPLVARQSLPRLTGLVTTLAQRLQAAAAPGEVLVCARTAALCRDRRLTPRKGLHLKGFEGEYEAYSVELSATPHALRVGRTFVGRQAERACLRNLDRPCLVTGEAGIGKSALVNSVIETAPSHVIFAADALKRSESQHPFRQWLRSRMGSESSDFALLCGTFPNLVPDDQLALALTLDLPQGQALVARFAQLALRQRIEDAIAHTVLMAVPAGGVLVFEDLHWFDRASLDTLRRVLELNGDQRGILLTSRDPESAAEFLQDRQIMHLELAPLAASDARKFMELAGGAGLDGAEQNRLIRHAGGVPLFLEQLLIHRLDHPGSDALPATLEDLLTARIDAAGPARGLLMQAAIIGRGFSLRLLKALAAPAADCPEMLERASAMGIVEHLGDDGWRFVHALLHQASYRQMLRATREGLHARVADLLQGECADLPGNSPALRASHRDRARQFLPAAQDYIAAGRAAMLQGAFTDAEAHLRSALRMCHQGAAGPGADLLEMSAQTALGSVLMQMQGYAAAPVREAFDAVLNLARGAAGMPASAAAALFGSYSHAIIAGDRPRADQLCTFLETGAQAERGPLRETYLLAAHTAANCGHFYSGEFPAQFRRMEQIRAIYDVRRHAPMIVDFGMDCFAAAQMFEVPARVICGEGHRLDALMAETDAHQRALNIPVMQPYALVWGAVPLFHAGRSDEALQRLERGIVIAREQGQAFWQVIARCWQHVIDPTQSADAEGCADFARTIATLETIGALIGIPYFKMHLAMALARGGDTAAAEILAEQAVSDGNRSRLWCWQSETLRLRAMLQRQAQQQDEALLTLHQAYSLSQEQGAILWQVRAALDLIDLGSPANLLTSALAALPPGADIPELRRAELSP
ncbi:adenylate/guanylate cyclase domain-containing protein [Paracoccus litorisediminis]|uniref:AAA family ATPase n=1 Tax=Paracoccus litorisediminis TaxID=2006130 RepID=A0A844HS73_9RHOB|nr:adenylate/guanylate cyclase domain-containing protein [Paracoccus litorisediminis]MTH61055.1 AAA family ATPase [Paracoccus litorisediminis]